MTSDENFDEFLSRTLKDNQRYLADDGFADGVMAALPAERSLMPVRKRLAVMLPGLLISLVVLMQIPLMESAHDIWRWLAAVDLFSLLKLGAIVTGSLLILACGWLARQMDLL